MPTPAAPPLRLDAPRRPLGQLESSRGPLGRLEDEARRLAAQAPAPARPGDAGLSAADRIAAILDPGGPWLELGASEGRTVIPESQIGAGLMTGVGEVRGRPVVLVATVPAGGGVWYADTVAKLLRAQEIALRQAMPIVYVLEGGRLAPDLPDGFLPAGTAPAGPWPWRPASADRPGAASSRSGPGRSPARRRSWPSLPICLWTSTGCLSPRSGIASPASGLARLRPARRAPRAPPGPPTGSATCCPPIIAGPTTWSRCLRGFSTPPSSTSSSRGTAPRCSAPSLGSRGCRSPSLPTAGASSPPASVLPGWAESSPPRARAKRVLHRDREPSVAAHPFRARRERLHGRRGGRAFRDHPRRGRTGRGDGRRRSPRMR